MHLPASKSLSNRALILNALAGGAWRIENLSDADDTRVLQQALMQGEGIVDIGAAGTAMRFLTAYFALQDGTRILTGTERMKQRPIGILVEALRKLGADITVDKNTIAVKGSFNNRLHGAKVSSHGDHRLALALKVAQLIADGPVEIDDTQCISKSWPDFNLEV